MRKHFLKLIVLSTMTVCFVSMNKKEKVHEELNSVIKANIEALASVEPDFAEKICLGSGNVLCEDIGVYVAQVITKPVK